MFGKRLRELLVEKDLSHTDFARKLRMASAQLYLILGGKSFPSDKRLAKMIKVMESPAEEAGELWRLLALGRAKGKDREYIEELERQVRQNAADNNAIPITGPVPRVPVFDLSTELEMTYDDAGYPLGVSEQHISTPGLSDPQAFGCTIHGDNMTPKLVEGDIVIFSPQTLPEDGDICFVCADDVAVVKQVFFEKKELRLVTFNHAYSEQRVGRTTKVRVWPMWGVFRLEQRED